VRWAAVLVACVLVLSGCGLGSGAERGGSGAELRVTRDFGHERLGAFRVKKVREDETVMRLLRSRFDVETRYGGRFVQSIEGLSGKGASGRADWFFFVNGLEASVGAVEYELSPGDVVQWDYRRWDGAMRVPAIVGVFPEPFLHGVNGRRRPVRVECADESARSCRLVKNRLDRLGVAASGASLGTSGTRQVLRVVVAPWERAKIVSAVSRLEKGPEDSGVFARVTRDGRQLDLLGPGGEVARRAPAGTGLVAAFAPSEDQIVWLVSGLDERGVDAAAETFDKRSLRDAYAVAATPAGTVKLP
jgi:Domain of unknown function (DUF4430)